MTRATNRIKRERKKEDESREKNFQGMRNAASFENGRNMSRAVTSRPTQKYCPVCDDYYTGRRCSNCGYPQ